VRPLRLAPDDTIVAISTPPGIGGLAVIRLSGPQAKAVIQPYFDAFHRLTPRTAVYGHLKHADLSGETFDDCVATYFPGPNSYTGEDILELSIHGGAYLQERLLAVLSGISGVRLADPGEFTLRAFLAGRLDLTQAEAVADLIHARDSAAHRSARHQLHGELDGLLQGFKAVLVQVLTQIEAELDFSDQEIDFTPLETHTPTLTGLQARVQQLLNTYFYGKRVVEGFRVPLVGPPNAGKSTLFNALLGHSRAIVNPEPGTTRDTIETTMVLDDHSVVLVDTAGLRDTENLIEQDGVDRSLEELQRADLVIAVDSPDTAPTRVELPVDTPLLRVFTKSDIAPKDPDPASLTVSGKTGIGLAELKQQIARHLDGLRRTSSSVIITNQRHVNVLEAFAGRVEAVLVAIQDQRGPEYVAADLHQALQVLGEITGETTPDEILGNIFNNFCIGK